MGQKKKTGSKGVRHSHRLERLQVFKRDVLGLVPVFIWLLAECTRAGHTKHDEVVTRAIFQFRKLSDHERDNRIEFMVMMLAEHKKQFRDVEQWKSSLIINAALLHASEVAVYKTKLPYVYDEDAA